eukprot:7742339-Pyramimonas_sp.AAC.1
MLPLRTSKAMGASVQLCPDHIVLNQELTHLRFTPILTGRQPFSTHGADLLHRLLRAFPWPKQLSSGRSATMGPFSASSSQLL